MASTTELHPPARLNVVQDAHARQRRWGGGGWACAVAVLGLGLALGGTDRAAWAQSVAGTAVVAVPARPAASAPVNPGSGTSGRNAKPTLGCLIGPERVADIGSPVVGVVSDLKVDNGDVVQAGQTLVALQAEVEHANVQAAQARSAIEADVLAAHANLKLSHQRYVRAAELLSQGFVSPQAVEQARAERDVAQQKLQQAQGQLQVNRQELKVVQAQLGLRTVRSPFRGVVVERFVNVGERVDDKPMLRVAMLDPLRVELVMPANRWGSVALDQSVAVIPELPGAVSVSGRVTHIDKVIDAASNTFRVRLSLPNPGFKLPAGARCRVSDPGLAATALPRSGASLPAVKPL